MQCRKNTAIRQNRDKVLYDIDIIYFDGSIEYLLGRWDNVSACLRELQGFREYKEIEQLVIKPKT